MLISSCLGLWLMIDVLLLEIFFNFMFLWWEIWIAWYCVELYKYFFDGQSNLTIWKVKKKIVLWNSKLNHVIVAEHFWLFYFVSFNCVWCFILVQLFTLLFFTINGALLVVDLWVQMYPIIFWWRLSFAFLIQENVNDYY